MLLNLWMTLQFVVVLFSAELDAVHPQSPVHALVLVLLGAALLSPLAARAARTIVRVLSLAARGPRIRTERSEAVEFEVPEAPGTPGTVRSRAPSVVHATV